MINWSTQVAKGVPEEEAAALAAGGASSTSTDTEGGSGSVDPARAGAGEEKGPEKGPSSSELALLDSFASEGKRMFRDMREYMREF